MTSVLLAHPGDTTSTSDVYTGLRDGLRAQGVTVYEFLLAEWIGEYETLIEGARLAGLDHRIKDVFAHAGWRCVAMAAWKQPTYFVAVTGLKLHPTVPLIIRRMGIPTALVLTESPYALEQECGHAVTYDTVFTNERAAVLRLKDFRQRYGQTPNVHYLPHAYNPTVHTPGMVEADLASDALFIGTAFPERLALFDGANWDGLRFVRRGIGWAKEWDITPNADSVRYYRSASVNINHHRTAHDLDGTRHIAPGEAESANPRAYELAACGVFQLADDSRPEVRALFGDSVPTYRAGDSSDLERQVRYWHARPDARLRLAAAARQAVQDHTWTARAGQLLEVLTQQPGGTVHAVPDLAAA